MTVRNLVILKSDTMLICRPYEKKICSREVTDFGMLSGVDCIKRFGGYEVSWWQQTKSDDGRVSVLQMVIKKPTEKQATICGQIGAPGALSKPHKKLFKICAI